jgi:hypothetical protein
MAGFWHEPEWQAAGDLTEQQPDAPEAGNITSHAWHGWWHEGCPGL